MFAYCNNNPTCYADPHGDYRIDVFPSGFSEEFGGERRIANHLYIGQENASVQRIDEYIFNVMSYTPEIDYRDISNLLNKSTTKALWGTKRVLSGISSVKNGAWSIAYPIPLLFDDILGGYQVANGVYNILRGIIEIVVHGKGIIDEIV